MIQIRPIQGTDFDTALRLRNDTRPYDPITSRVFKRKVLLDVNFDPNGYLLAFSEDRAEGFIYVVRRLQPLDNDGDFMRDLAWLNGFGAREDAPAETAESLIRTGEDFAGAFGVYQMIVCRTFINSTIPGEMLEAAKIDGCSDARYFMMFIVPLSKAIIAVMTLQYAVGHWNSYFSAYIYLTNKSLFPLQVFLREILVMNQIQASDFTDEETLRIMQGMADLLKYSLIVVATAPIMCVYPFIQKYFVQGIMIGSLKG